MTSREDVALFLEVMVNKIKGFKEETPLTKQERHLLNTCILNMKQTMKEIVRNKI